jgi:hypothetical protein
METKENWIENIFNSTQGIAQVSPSDDLFSKIQQRILRNEKVAPRTVWLVAASIIILVLLNITAIKSKVYSQEENQTTYLSSILSENNQIYQ